MNIHYTYCIGILIIYECCPIIGVSERIPWVLQDPQHLQLQGREELLRSGGSRGMVEQLILCDPGQQLYGEKRSNLTDAGTREWKHLKYLKAEHWKLTLIKCGVYLILKAILHMIGG